MNLDNISFQSLGCQKHRTYDSDITNPECLVAKQTWSDCSSHPVDKQKMAMATEIKRLQNGIKQIAEESLRYDLSHATYKVHDGADAAPRLQEMARSLLLEKK